MEVQAQVEGATWCLDFHPGFLCYIETVCSLVLHFRAEKSSPSRESNKRNTFPFHALFVCSICVQNLAPTAAHSPQALTFMVVKVVEPELQGPDTAGMEK